jgi:hypothetical protein
MSRAHPHFRRNLLSGKDSGSSPSAETLAQDMEYRFALSHIPMMHIKK